MGPTLLKRVFREMSLVGMCSGKRKPSAFALIKAFIACVRALSVFLLIAIQVAFSIDAPVPWLHPVWDANGLLGYLGALVGSISAVAVLYFSLLAGREDRNHSDVMNVLPCIALSCLSEKQPHMPKNGFAHGVFTDADPRDDEYKSGALDCVDRLLIDGGAPAISCDESLVDEHAANRYAISSMGAGPAVNVRVGIANRNEWAHFGTPHVAWCQTRQLPVGGESELVIYFRDEAKPVMEAGYRIAVTYSDILGNRYLQYFPMTFDGQDDVLKCTVKNSITRIGIP